MNSKLRYGIIALMVLLLAIVFVLIGISVGATFTGQAEFLEDSSATWIASLATVVIALLTIILAIETQSMRRLQQEQIDKIRTDAIRPDVDLYLGFSQAAFNFADLTLRNNGSGMARDVRIVFSHVAGRGSSEHAQEIIEKLLKPSFSANGVSTLGPRRELSSFVISFLDLAGDANEPIMDVCIEAAVDCKDADGKDHHTVSIIDMAEFRGISELGGRPAHDTVRQLKNIGKQLENLTSGAKSIRVNTYTSNDRQEEKEELDRRFAEQRRRREENKGET